MRETYLITGISGFIGINLANYMLNNNHNIVGVSRSELTSYDKEMIGLTDNFTLHKGSITDYSFIDSVINKYEITHIIHLAADAIVRRCEMNPINCFKSNIEGTWNVLESARQNKTVRSVVVAESDKSYGHSNDLPYFEDGVLDPKAPYEASKAAAGMICRAYYETYGLPVTTFRGCNVFGPKDLNFSRILPNSCRLLIENKSPVIYKHVSEFKREFIYVGDMVKALFSMSDNIDITGGEVYNVGSGATYKVGDVVNKLCKVPGKDIKPEFPEKDIPFLEIPEQYLSVDKIKEHIGWEATQTIENFEGCLEKTYNWYKEYYSV